MTKLLLVLFAVTSLSVFAGRLPDSAGGSSSRESSRVSLNELKTLKRFGIGLSVAGPLSVLGMECDVNLNEYVSVSGGIGTGLDYSTLMFKGRFFLPGQWVSPYLAGGFARWWTSGTKERSLSPSVLVNRFLPAGYNYADGFDVVMFYPAIGVQFMHPMGVAFFAEVQYLFRLFSMANGTYAGMGVHWYF